METILGIFVGGKVLYPDILLPRLRYKKITNNLSHYYLSRTTPSKDIINQSSQRVKDEALYEKPLELFDYSTNLLGHFNLEHNFISLCGTEKKYFRTYWEYDEEVRTPVYKSDFIVDKEKGHFFLPIGKIHNQIQVPFKNVKKTDDTLHSIIVHSPTRSNFWHFSIRWVDQKGDVISPNDSKWKYAVTGSIRAALLEQIEYVMPVGLQPLPQSEYYQE